jgi:hypothetical protein
LLNKSCANAAFCRPAVAHGAALVTQSAWAVNSAGASLEV